MGEPGPNSGQTQKSAMNLSEQRENEKMKPGKDHLGQGMDKGGDNEQGQGSPRLDQDQGDHLRRRRVVKIPRELLELRRKRTTDIVRSVFNSVLQEFEFTTELETDFDTGFIPTLDTQLRVMEDGSICYIFFEKPVSSKLIIMERSALSDTLKQSSLAQEVIRRMSNTLEHVTLVDRRRDTEADRYVTKDMVMEILAGKSSFGKAFFFVLSFYFVNS